MNRNIYAHQWEVPSTTDPEKTYKVSLKHDGTYVCSCPHNIYRKKTCDHIKAVLKYEGVRVEFEAWQRLLRAFGIFKLA